MALITCITTSDHTVHVIPLSVLARIAHGEIPLSHLDDHEMIIRAILQEWLDDYLAPGAHVSNHSPPSLPSAFHAPR